MMSIKRRRTKFLCCMCLKPVYRFKSSVMNKNQVWCEECSQKFEDEKKENKIPY